MLKRCSARAHVGGHQFTVEPQIEQFFSVPSPPGKRAAGLGHHPLSSAARGRREWPNVNLETTGLIRIVGYPSAVGRETCTVDQELRTQEQGSRFATSSVIHREHPQ